MGQGTGRGLSMIYGFARQSGGRCESTRKSGRHEDVPLSAAPRGSLDDDGPTDKDAREKAAAATREEQRPCRSSTTSPRSSMLVTEILGELGYAPIEAGDGPRGEGPEVVKALVTPADRSAGHRGRPARRDERAPVADAARVTRPVHRRNSRECDRSATVPLDAGMELVTKPFSMEAAGRSPGQRHDRPDSDRCGAPVRRGRSG